MAPDRASAVGLLKGWGLSTRLASSADYTQPLTQVPSHTSCRTRTPFFKRLHTQIFCLTCKDGTLPTDMSACEPNMRVYVMNNCIGFQPCKTAGRYWQHLRLVSTKCMPSCIVDMNQLGSSIPIRRSGLQFDLLKGRFLDSRSLSSMASQKVDNHPQDPKMHAADSQAENLGSKEQNGKSKEAGSKQAVHEEALRGFEVLLDRMEASGGSGDRRLGATCLRLAQLSDSAGVDPARILSYGQRALRVYKSTKLSWEHVTCLHVIGHAYFMMGDFENTLAHLEQSASILKRLKPTVSEKDVNTLVHARESLIGQAKMSLGRFRDALPHFQKSFKLAEKILEPGNPHLGVAYWQAGQAYKEAKDPHEAICLCIKAVDNHANYYGPNSIQAANIRRFMSLVYLDLREYENALLEYETVRPTFEGLGKSEDVASLDLVAVEALLELERYDEAISKLKRVVSSTLETSLFHGNALVLLAKAYSIMKEHENATNYCKMALHMLENQQPSTDVGSSLVNLALVFQRQQEIELATSTYKKALEVYNEFSGHQAHAAVADIEGQIGFLLLHVEKVEEALPFLERSVSKKKAIHGTNSEELLDVHNHLGVAYSEEGKLDEALKQFEAAKSILSKNVTEVDYLTISIYSNLSNMYSVFSRFDDAIACQRIVIDSIRRNRDVETMVSLVEAKRTLEDLQREAENRKNESAKGEAK